MVCMVLLLGLAAGVWVEEMLELKPSGSDEVFTAYKCKSVEIRFVKEVCERCGADKAYVITEADTTYLKKYDKDEIARIGPVLQDFADELPEAEYYAVAISDDSVCLSGTKFDDDLDKEDLVDYFIGAEIGDLTIPEIFEDVSLDDEFVAVVHNGTDYVFLSFEDQTGTQVQATSTVLLDLLYVYYYFQEANEGFKFLGQAEIEGSNLTFEIDSNFEREENSEFTVRVLVGQSFTVEELSEMVVSEAGCNEIDPPRGVSSLKNFPVDELQLNYRYNSETEEMDLMSEKFKFKVYDYAVAPDIYLHNVTGFVVVDNSTLSCGYEFIGTWDYSPYSLTLTVYSQNSTGEMEALGKFIGLDVIPVEDIDRNFYQQLFPEKITLFPTYTPEDPAVISDLRTLQIYSPSIQLYFQPDTGFNIFGKSLIHSAEVIANRINGTVQTVVHKIMQSFEYIPQGFQVIQQDVYYSSEDIDINEGYTMSSLFDTNRTEWLKEIWIEQTVEFNDDCEDNVYCQILETNGKVNNGRITVTGYMVGSEVFVDYPLDNFNLTQGLEFKEAGLMIVYSSDIAIPIIEGIYDFRADSQSVLRVEAEIKQAENLTATVTGQNYEVWENALDASYINIISLSVNFQIFTPGSISEGLGKADAIVGKDCYSEETFRPSCLTGSVDLNFDLTNYVYNSLSLYLFNLSTFEFYTVVLGYPFRYSQGLRLPYNSLSFVAGTNILHEYGKDYRLVGGIQFAGVNAKVSGRIPELGGGIMHSEYELEDFYFALANARMTNAVGKLKLDRDADFYDSNIVGKLHMWDVQYNTEIIIAESFLFEFSGFVFDGLYNYSVHMEGKDDAQVTSASFTAKINLVQEAVEETQEYLEDELQEWIDVGIDANHYLNDLQIQKDLKLEEWEELTCDPDLECPTDVHCKDQVDAVCEKREIIQSCQSNSAFGCNDVKLICVEAQQVCIKRDPSCTTDCDCLSYVNVCQKWSKSCNQNSDACRYTYLHKDPDNCAKTVLDCEKEEIKEKKCRNDCEYKNKVYEKEREQYLVFSKGSNTTFEEIIGFSDLSELIGSKNELNRLIKLHEVYTVRTIDQSGIGPSDFKFNSKSELVSLSINDFAQYNMEFSWDFFNFHLNKATLKTSTKTGIISLSDERLFQQLSSKSPFELIHENIHE